MNDNTNQDSPSQRAQIRKHLEGFNFHLSGTHIADQPLPRAFTNFHRSQCELYQKAIDEWGKGTLFITDNAVDIDGKLIPDCMALNTSANGDISDFWKILRKLKSDSAVLG